MRNQSQQYSTDEYDPHQNPIYDHRYIHAMKAVGYGFLRVLSAFLPGIALSVLIWALVTGQGIQSAAGALMGLFTSLIAIASIPEFDDKMRHHWSIYQLLSDD